MLAHTRNPNTAADVRDALAAAAALGRVTFAPGLLKLATKPASTGSTPVMNTMGIAAVAALAARAGGVVFATSTAT